MSREFIQLGSALYVLISIAKKKSPPIKSIEFDPHDTHARYCSISHSQLVVDAKECNNIKIRLTLNIC